LPGMPGDLPAGRQMGHGLLALHRSARDRVPFRRRPTRAVALLRRRGHRRSELVRGEIADGRGRAPAGLWLVAGTQPGAVGGHGQLAVGGRSGRPP
jgi:hypothetical protein